MTERELISKLNNLKNVSPDQNWLKSNRDLLLTQISNSGATELSVWQTFIINFESLARTSLQPAVALGVFVLVLASGSLFGHQIFSQTKPNDSLYIARIISEKAKLGTVFNSESREKMAAQFAASHAQDIASTLADPQFNQAANQDQVAHLNESFGKEMETVKNRVEKLALVATKNSASAITANPDDQVFSAAENNKDDQGIQISDGKDLNNSGILNPNKPGSTLSTSTINGIAVAVNNSNTSTSTSPAIKTASSTPEETTSTETLPSTGEMLEEVKQLFENKDYDKAIDKLKEVEAQIK